jgi:hypothetical protein
MTSVVFFEKTQIHLTSRVDVAAMLVWSLAAMLFFVFDVKPTVFTMMYTLNMCTVWYVMSALEETVGHGTVQVAGFELGL